MIMVFRELIKSQFNYDGGTIKLLIVVKRKAKLQRSDFDNRTISFLIVPYTVLGGPIYQNEKIPPYVY